MNSKQIASRVSGAATTVFSEMTELARQHGAINLGQGFPDFPAPSWLKKAAATAVEADHNQYAPSAGVPELRQELSAHARHRVHRNVDPERELLVTSGATEAIMAGVLALVDPGDEVIVFEPFYDSYVQAVHFAGATPVYVQLYPPDDGHTAWWFDLGELAAAFGPATKLVILNTPTNPCGKCFTESELGELAELTRRHNAYLLSDEVYEFMVYDGRQHVSIASLPEMWERTVTVSSAGKTFSVTGWKIGWAIGPEPLIAALKRSHQFIVFCSATPLQYAAAQAFQEAQRRGYYEQLRREYEHKRDTLWETLHSVGLHPYPTEGTYFILCDISGLGYTDDVSFCRHLTTEAQVTAIPPSFFYSQAHAVAGRHMVRFSFCKKPETLEAAQLNLVRWAGA